MGYKPETGFWGKWDMYAEQLMLYVLGVASPTYPISKQMYLDMQKPKKDFNVHTRLICECSKTGKRIKSI